MRYKLRTVTETLETRRLTRRLVLNRVKLDCGHVRDVWYWPAMNYYSIGDKCRCYECKLAVAPTRKRLDTMTPSPTRNTTLSGLTDEDIDFWQQRAAELGLITKVGSGRGRGSMSEAVRAVPRGKATLLLTEDYNELVATLAELADLMDAVRRGDYTPDTTTAQPARAALAKHIEDGDA